MPDYSKFLQKNSKGNYTIIHFAKIVSPKTQVYHAMEHAEAVQSVNNKRGVGTTYECFFACLFLFVY